MWLVDKHNRVINEQAATKKAATEYSQKSLGIIYQTTRRHIPKDHDIYTNKWNKY
jgi:hypothetical protein